MAKQQEQTPSTTIVRSCSCQHEAQDSLHGKGLRVYNWAEKRKMWRCSVCKKERG